MTIINKKTGYFSSIFNIPPEFSNELKKILSYEDKSHVIARVMAKKRFGYIPKHLAKWDGVTHLITPSGDFPTGLIDKIVSFFKERNVQFTITGADSVPVIKENLNNKIEINLFPHQIDAMNAIIEKKHGMLQAATSFGKTKMSIKACQVIGAYPYLFLVNRISLLAQAHREYSNYFEEEIGWIGDGIMKIRKINIASIATLCSVLKIKHKSEEEEKVKYTPDQVEAIKELLKNTKFLVYDELHNSASTTSQSILKKIDAPEFKIGMSGTVFRNDNLGILLEASFGPIIYTKNASELIQDNFLTPPKIVFWDYKDPYLSKIYNRNNKKPIYASVYKDCIVENQKFNEMVAKLALANTDMNRLTLISVKQINHGNNILAEIQKLSDQEVIFLNGNNKKKLDFEKVLQDFSSRKFMILISTLLDEGTDIPAIDAVINAGAGRSAIKAIQLTGRALRKFEGKKFAYIYDFVHPYSHLYEHSVARCQILQTEKAFKVKVINWD